MAAAVMPEAPQNVATATSPLIAAVGAAGATLDALRKLHLFPVPADTFLVREEKFPVPNGAAIQLQHTGIAVRFDVGAAEKGPEKTGNAKIPRCFPCWQGIRCNPDGAWMRSRPPNPHPFGPAAIRRRSAPNS